MDYGLKLYVPKSSKQVKKMLSMKPEKLGALVQNLGGFRKVEKKFQFTLAESMDLLSRMTSDPKLELSADAYFDSYSSDEKKIPNRLYRVGFGHMLEQTLVKKNKWKLCYFQHLTCMDLPYFDTDRNAVEAKVDHEPADDFESYPSCDNT